MKKIIGLLVMISLLVSIAPLCVQSAVDKLEGAVAIKVGSRFAYVDNEKREIDPNNKHVVPIVRNDRALVPIRFVSESFGATIDFDDTTQTATIHYNGKVIKLIVDSDTMYIDDQPVHLDSPAISVNYRLFIPLRRLCEDALGKQIFYDYHLIVISDMPNLIDPVAEKLLVERLHGMFKDTEKLSYMIYYAELNDEIIEAAKKYQLVILHPKVGKITRDQIQQIRQGIDPNDPQDDVYVLGYISIGEDLRTAGMTAEQMKADTRFTGDGSGPRIDPRNGGTSFDGIDPLGAPSKNGTGFASYYLDDNDFDGNPDFNKNFNCAFTNAGDPAWFEELNKMTMDGEDMMPGMREILTDDYGRGLGCDGLFLDTIDTCAPNSYTDENSPNQSEFEWTTPGFSKFIEKLKFDYPDKLVLQNRGLFFFDPWLPHYKFNAGKSIDFLMFESYMLDSNPADAFNPNFYADNKNAFMPKIMAEAGRPGGFRVVSLGYAEGPPQLELKETLTGQSQTGLSILLEDLWQTEDIAGFSHYITDGGVVLVNDFVLTHKNNNDTIPPMWSGTYNDSSAWPPHEPTQRIGIQQAVPVSGGVTVRWDVALDKNNVTYTLYYQNTPFDFNGDPNLTTAQSIVLSPIRGDGYENGVTASTYPYQATITGLSNQNYYFVIRAMDDSPNKNQEKNTTVLECTPMR